MLFVEAMDRLETTFPVKIFATDINPLSIEVAREGLYLENIVAALSERRLNHFFIPHEEQYRVDGRLRDMLVFSVHDLTRDPPFSRLDVVSCRNLLIYMDSALQRKVLPVLHYSLNPGGLLFLGSSEEVGEFTEEHFVPVNRKSKLFRARALPATWRHEIFLTPAPQRDRNGRTDSVRPSPQKPPRERSKERLEAPLRQLIEAKMMKDYAPPGVLVDKDNRIVYFQGEVGRFVHPAPGAPTFEVLKMVPGPLAEPLAELLQSVRSERRRVSRTGFNLALYGGSLTVDLVVKPMPEAGREAALIIFEEQESEGVESDDAAADARLAAVERELYVTRQDLHSTIEELETANEELQANNEELQSTNEEMETSREELQSTNEELDTVNTELKQKNDELIQTNDDINNLFGATDIATMILDTDLRIKRFTPAATAFFHLVPSDLGRRLTDIGTTLIYDAMEEDLKEVLRTLKDRSCEIKSREGKWCIVHLLPYRTGRNIIAGVILTFWDVTALKEAQIDAQQAREFAESVLDTMREPFLVLDGELRVVSANSVFLRTFQVSSTVTQGVPVFELGNNQWDIPDLRRLLNEIIPENRTFKDFEVNHTFPSIGRRTMLLNARRIDRDGDEGNPNLILLAFQDITADTHTGERE
jgi:two-component system CheB/CheR fusion protein